MSRRLISFVALAALYATASAHTGADAGAHHGFGAGFAHPFTGIDHLLAMLAVGLWSAIAAPAVDRRMLAWPVAFAAVLLVGALMGAAGVTLPLVEPAIAASVLILGLLVATRARLPLAAGSALVAAFALFHGLAHGGELGGAAALAGMVLATALLHGAGLGLGVLLRTRATWLGRAAGALVGVCGLALLVH
jgi:urease accessory protein